jgi:hypothetical protein
MRIYSCEAAESLSASWLIAGMLVVGFAGVLGVVALRRTEWRPAFADVLWFVVPLLPVVNLIDLGSRNLTADRFLYLPMLGVAAILARGMLWLLDQRPAMGKASAVTIALFVVGFAVVTSLHSRVFASSSSFWEYEARRNTENPFALHAVGTARTLAGLRDTGLAFLERAQQVAEGTCVHADQVRAAKDLGWALSLRARPSDRQELIQMRAAYAQVPSSGFFAYDGPSGWSVQLTPEEARDFVSDELHYILPRATIEARLGNIDEAVKLLEAAGSVGELHPQARSLRLRLLAVRRHAQPSPAESVKHDSAGGLENLTSVLATMDETVEHAHIPEERRGSLAAYALGFGQAPNELDALPPRDRAILEALRAFSSDEPVDIEGIQAYAEDSNELPRFIGLARASSELRRLDAQLR